ncbi:hypothetical protein CY34DRAFT_796856 [Suillus luteus UH-Slu-Lm8-n1]|uniref:Uncharacterized protein n=1 Tax=Suillus luteus UH-Slu-Lm8-n1 TaxID=930992 RepID=A0A0D0BVA1_9AGAM|nr:hypothetical protein CY34DRAFT_796856 [Suillus luteus UH-Slu-Lm8-n1]
MPKFVLPFVATLRFVHSINVRLCALLAQPNSKILDSHSNFASTSHTTENEEARAAAKI